MLSNVGRVLLGQSLRSGHGLRTTWVERQTRLRTESTLTPNSHHHHQNPPTATPPHASDDAPDLPPLDRSKALRFTQSPNADWELGHKVPALEPGAGPAQSRKRWDMDTVPPRYVCNPRCSRDRSNWRDSTLNRDAYKLLTSAIVPRPIAFVSTISHDGIRNLAPFRSVQKELPTVPRFELTTSSSYFSMVLTITIDNLEQWHPTLCLGVP